LKTEFCCAKAAPERAACGAVSHWSTFPWVATMRRHHNAGPHVRRRQYTSTGIWLGLFAMLMIHVGPLFSALQAAAAPTAPLAMVAPHDAHAHHDHNVHDVLADDERHGGDGMYHRSLPGEPAGLAAPEMCGYCELLTLN